MRLGDTEGPSSSASAFASEAASSQEAPEIKKPEKVTRTLTFWADGLSVDDGPLLKSDDPSYEAILEQLKSGYIILSSSKNSIVKHHANSLTLDQTKV